jgi:hypothetical protein
VLSDVLNMPQFKGLGHHIFWKFHSSDDVTFICGQTDNGSAGSSLFVCLLPTLRLLEVQCTAGMLQQAHVHIVLGFQERLRLWYHNAPILSPRQFLLCLASYTTFRSSANTADWARPSSADFLVVNLQASSTSQPLNGIKLAFVSVIFTAWDFGG